MSLALGAFQDAFIDAARGNPGAPDSAERRLVAELAGQAGFDLYRNTLMKGCVDALRANFPAVERLVGADWFGAAAALHVRQSPPASVQLLDYGLGFADFLDAFEPARDLPYLGAVARLDRLWVEVFAAAERPSLALGAIADLGPEALGALCLRPRPALRWLWCADMPAYSIWRHQREERPLPDSLEWHGEGALLGRSDGQVTWQPLGPGGCAFLDACARGLTLDEASGLALAADPTLDFIDLLGRLLAAGAFTPLLATRDT
ncbi:DNA-binding domain-containing protein [Pseudomonas solani]|uniref:HvfC/BufC family peptide modification chaperone n=1 Tax=Pseudomonas solani TaxID=2731552 RepID=UPI0035BEA003